ncbi:MAG: hypothetical protein ACI4OV_01005 [Victivallaceae bacterium]
MKKLFVFCAAATAALLTGCARDVVIPEVMQLPVDGKIYTRCNIWFTNPEDISCLNYQEGRILPIGSEIVPVSATEKEIVFTSGDVEYTINFDADEMMIPVESYIERIFTLEPVDVLLADVSPENQARIKSGAVIPGMSRDEVIFAFGYPAAGRTPNLSNTSYLYYQSKDRTFRVVFSGDEVRNIIPPLN